MLLIAKKLKNNTNLQIKKKIVWSNLYNMKNNNFFNTINPKKGKTNRKKKTQICTPPSHIIFNIFLFVLSHISFYITKKKTPP